MKNFRDEVNAIMSVLADAVIDAKKLDESNESAGRRARVALRSRDDEELRPCPEDAL